MVEPTHLNNMFVFNGFIFPKDRGEKSEDVISNCDSFFCDTGFPGWVHFLPWPK